MTWLVIVAVTLLLCTVLPAVAAATEAETQPVIDVPEATWMARLLGRIGLPTLLIMAGVVMGAITAGVVIAVVRAKDKRRASGIDADAEGPGMFDPSSTTDRPV